LDLTGLRLAGAVYDFALPDLHLDREGIESFVSQLSGKTITPAQAVQLYRCIDGSPAGLQLAALALGAVPDVPRFFSELASKDGDTATYLSDIVFNHLPRPIADFVGFTALFERFSAELCNSLLSDRESPALLAQVKERGLFLIPLDREHRWYRYHPLFADYLRSQYLAQRAQEAKEIYRKGSRWFEQHELIREAIRYALAGNDYVHAADLVAESAYALVWQHGDYAALLA
jgi:LuxR family maltose regulon positive regulatory protein